MSIQLLKKLPTPTEIKADYPVTQKVAQIKAERDEMIRKVFTGESDKFLSSSDLVPQITKRQFVNISTVCPGYRKKWQIS